MIISSWVVNYSNFTPYIANFYISYGDFLFKRKSLKCKLYHCKLSKKILKEQS